MENVYYVYEWFIIDPYEVFYVGKGTGNRRFEVSGRRRSEYFKRIFNKYNCAVRLIGQSLTEKEALDLEIEMIAYYKSIGQCRANITNGGDGMSGYHHSIEARRRISETSKLRWSDVEYREKLSKLHQGENNHFYGRTHSECTKRAIGQKNSGFRHTDDAKRRMSINRSGEKNGNFGRDFSEQHREKLRQATLRQLKEKGHPNLKEMYMVDRDNNIVRIFGSYVEAITGEWRKDFPSPHGRNKVIDCIKKNKEFHGYRIVYAKDYNANTITDKSI